MSDLNPTVPPLSSVMSPKPTRPTKPTIRSPNFCMRTPKTRMTTTMPQTKAEESQPYWTSLSPNSFWTVGPTTASTARSR